MLLLVPDARFAGFPDVEQEAAGNLAGVRAYRASSLDGIPDETWREADGILFWGTGTSFRCDGAMLDRAVNCRIVVRMGVGFDAVDVGEAGRRGVAVCNVPDYGTADVADHAIGLMLSLTRGIVRHHAALRDQPMERAWRPIVDEDGDGCGDGAEEGSRRRRRPRVVRRIRGSTLGIVGCGRIGTAVGLRARALGMRVVFYDPYVPDGTEQALGFERVETLEGLLRDADVVTLHTPLTEATRNMINEGSIAWMKCDGILINTSRGEVVNLDAVTKALMSDDLAAVALDVQPKEPPDLDHPFWKGIRNMEDWTLGRCVVTPHAAWYSPDGLIDIRTKGTKTAIDFLTRNTLRNCVNGEFMPQVVPKHCD